jgi:N-acetylmuramoyl-L-alanine amidase
MTDLPLMPRAAGQYQQFSAADVDIMARTLYGEARGSTRDDRLACGWVIRNRAVIATQFMQKFRRRHPNFGDGSLAAVCLDPFDFSCWNKNDPNRSKLDRLILPGSLNDKVFFECMMCAMMVIDGTVSDPTFGSTHYHTVAMGWPKAWGERKNPVITIGAHAFYNTVD